LHKNDPSVQEVVTGFRKEGGVTIINAACPPLEPLFWIFLLGLVSII
jgi:hypothetical protein